MQDFTASLPQVHISTMRMYEMLDFQLYLKTQCNNWRFVPQGQYLLLYLGLLDHRRP